MAKKILLVEDEDDLRTTVMFRLQSLGYQVIPAVDGLEALAKARSDAPDLIILDVMLPKMDGYKVCGLLKRDGRLSKIPVIIFTARAEEEARATAKEMGADAYITKPFEIETFVAKIRELVGEK
jgi:two-component system alkaline phosphatase synthesis response regulator PhoP